MYKRSSEEGLGGMGALPRSTGTYGLPSTRRLPAPAINEEQGGRNKKRGKGDHPDLFESSISLIVQLANPYRREDEENRRAGACRRRAPAPWNLFYVHFRGRPVEKDWNRPGAGREGGDSTPS